MVFDAGARLRWAPVGVAALGLIPAAIGWELTAQAEGWGSALAVVVGLVLLAPFVVVGVVMARRLRQQRPRLIVDDNGLSLIRGGRQRTVRWSELAAVAVERQRAMRPVTGSEPPHSLVGWPAADGEPLRLTATAEPSPRPPAGGFRLVDLGWFGDEEPLVAAIRTKAGSRWRD